MTATELRPCPFCGGAGRPTGSMSWTHISCDDCGAYGPKVFHGGPTDDRATLNRCEAEAIAAWNRCAPDAPHTRTGYTTVDPSEGEQAKPCYPDPVMDAVRRCAEIATGRWMLMAGTMEQHREREYHGKAIAHEIAREFGLLPASET